jgi:hypothetical protein
MDLGAPRLHPDRPDQRPAVNAISVAVALGVFWCKVFTGQLNATAFWTFFATHSWMGDATWFSSWSTAMQRTTPA